jgi:hypothetical protein
MTVSPEDIVFIDSLSYRNLQVDCLNITNTPQRLDHANDGFRYKTLNEAI